VPNQPIMPPNEVGALRKAPGGVKQKYILDDRGRQLIIDLYDGSSKRLDMISREMPGIPRSTITRWASRLGKVIPPENKWSQEQDDYLRKNIRKKTMSQLERYLRKERTTIVRRARKLDLYKEDDYDGYSMEDLVLGFGFSGDDKIFQWMRKGWIKGHKKLVAFQLEKYYFGEKAVKDFILNHPDQLNPHKFDWLWIADILTGSKGLGRLDEDSYGERTS